MPSSSGPLSGLFNVGTSGTVSSHWSGFGFGFGFGVGFGLAGDFGFGAGFFGFFGFFSVSHSSCRNFSLSSAER